MRIVRTKIKIPSHKKPLLINKTINLFPAGKESQYKIKLQKLKTD